jgi:hypothetical protein
MDGYMHSFRGEDPLLEELPISIDDLRSLDLLDSETNEMVASRDPFYRQRLKDAPLFNADSNDIRALFNGQLESSGVNAPGTRSAQASTARNLFQWHKRGKIPFDISERSGDIEKHGRLFRREGTDTAGFLRTMIKLREAQGMFHPWLFATGPLEAFQRASVVEAGALLSGESTSALGRRFSQLQERINASSFAGTQLGRALGADVKPRFDADSIRFMQNAISAAGRLPEFRSFIHGEIFEHDTPLDASAAERGLTKIVNKVGSWQDPFRGAPQRNIGQLYLGAAARAILNGVDGDAVPLNTLLVDFTRDVEAIAKAAPRAHAMALRTLENTRGINETWGSLLFGGAIDSLARSENALINFSANVFGKIPYRFQKYAFSLAENITGAQFVGALVTLAMQGRSSGKKWGKLQAFLSGRRGQPDPNVDGTDVLLETLQSADFADMFIRSGLTHTALATVALAMGSLDGEDDEDERRRKAEEVQGSGHVYDPRDLTNDFRNADSIFLEDIPLLGAAFQVTTQGGEIASPVELHWVLKQFVSPALGISKFAKTGDLRQILWGFQDAIGSFPLVDTMRFDDAMKTADQLFQKATDTASNANEESIPEAFEFVLNGVMTLERMLFENSFINSIYVASDRYDRDPWRIVDLDATGEIQRDDLSAPMAADALSRYLGDGETTQTGYAEYDYAQGTIRGYAESRLGVAIAGSLFTGLTGGAPIFRQNQAIRERTINKEEIDPQLAEQLILSQWDPNNEREVLTRDGAEAVLRGLHAQTVKPGDPALDNIYISAEMRDEIERSLMAQILQEGYDLGLNEEEATDRLNRVYYGSGNSMATPLYEVVWSQGRFLDAIPYTESLKYRQLNTTYVIGPDGYPMATGITRDSLYSMWGQAPLMRYDSGAAGLPVDTRLNSVDPSADLNTGMRALERVEENILNPTMDDILENMDDNFKKVVDAIKKASWSESNNNGYGYGGRRYGGGGGGGGYYNVYRHQTPERNEPIYSRNNPFVNVDNPMIRRARIERERFSNERGRLKPWQ